MATHQPVLLNEVIEMMNVNADGHYIDATFGRGGHARAILAGLSQAGSLDVCDRDPMAIAAARALAREDKRVHWHHDRFARFLEAQLAKANTFDGILLDVGVSSPQVDDAARGFSFRDDGPLDMRMNPDAGESAAAWLARASETEISDVLWHYGEERRSRQIAHLIVSTRTRQPINTTNELAQLVRRCVRRSGRIDPATRTFQALRIHINDELGELENALKAAVQLLKPDGRLLVIAFHSLEDRIVKLHFRQLGRQASNKFEPRDNETAFKLITRKPVMASDNEKTLNPRARSARLRVLERVQ